MKMKGFILIAVLIVANSAYANITFKASEDSCSNVAGLWTGSGTVKAGFITCHYNGVATVTATDATTFSMDIDLKKDSGICPNEERLILPGSCVNGALTLKTDDANLNGSLSNNGTVADLYGTVSFNIFGSRITADVDDMHMQKQ